MKNTGAKYFWVPVKITRRFRDIKFRFRGTKFVFTEYKINFAKSSQTHPIKKHTKSINPSWGSSKVFFLTFLKIANYMVRFEPKKFTRLNTLITTINSSLNADQVKY